MTLTLYAAVDVVTGRASQVVLGDTEDPLEVASGFVEDGASWLHVVDLDRAFRRGHNMDLLRGLITAAGVPVQLSGGIDDTVTLRAAADTGAQRINLASTALLDDDHMLSSAFIVDAVAQHGARVVVGIDVRAGVVVARGSNVEVGTVDQVVASVASTGATQFLVADASRDGSRRGVDAQMFASVTAALRHVIPDARVVVSGGVAGLDDLRALARLESDGVCGVVLGSALHQGAFTLAQARAAVSG